MNSADFEQSTTRSTAFWTTCLLSTALTAAAVGAASGGAELGWIEEYGHHECTSAGCLHGKLEYAEMFGSAAAAWNEETGEDLRHFPPDRVVDYKHMKLHMRFEDLNDMSFSATETLTVVPFALGAESLRLNALRLDIEDVVLDGRPVEYFHDGEMLTLRFDPPLDAGRTYDITIEYTCDRPVDGMFFTPSNPDTPDYTAEVHTQGQTESNRNWFVCHDFPNEQMSTELIVNVPERFAVSANGRLVSSLRNNDRAVWHYLQEEPHVSYLVSLVIGEFDIVEIPHDTVPMQVWVPKGLADRVMRTYGMTGDMIDMFERYFGVPYPYDRYDQLVVKNFGAGGMENTTVTSMYPTAIFDATELKENDLDGLIAHELAHQWTGDMITCKSWAHIWLNEGWATYGSALWEEERRGEDGYYDAMRRSFRVARRDQTTNDLPMVSPIYGDAWEVFRRAANPYPKGSSILHMLRCMLGDEVFFEGVHLYMNRHKFGVAETSDFRYAMEEVSGLGLEWFFRQWCYRPGTPNLDVRVQYDGVTRELLVDVDQTQTITQRTPAFRFTLPVHVRTRAGDEIFEIDVDSKSTNFRTRLDGAPIMVQVDPRLHVLKTIDIDMPRGWWMTQATEGETIAARRDAIDALREYDAPATIDLLRSIAEDTEVWYTERESAIGAIASYGSDEAREALLEIYDAGIEDPRVRATAIAAFDNYDLDIVRDRLMAILDEDPGYDTRVSAIGVLAELEAEDAAERIASMAHVDSQHDQIRTAAIRALRELEDDRGRDIAMQYAKWGHHDRSRATVIGELGRMATDEDDEVIDFIIDLLDDPHTRPRRAAGEALVEIGSERGLDPLRAMARSHPDPAIQERAERWVAELEAKVTE